MIIHFLIKNLFKLGENTVRFFKPIFFLVHKLFHQEMQISLDLVVLIFLNTLTFFSIITIGSSNRQIQSIDYLRERLPNSADLMCVPLK